MENKQQLHIISSQKDVNFANNLALQLQRIYQNHFDISPKIESVDENNSEKMIVSKNDIIIYLVAEENQLKKISTIINKHIEQPIYLLYLKNDISLSQLPSNAQITEMYIEINNTKKYWLNLISLCYESFAFYNYDNKKDSVFIAQSDKEFSTFKQEITRELIRKGMNVLFSNETTEKTLFPLLEKCKLSIHIIGHSFLADNTYSSPYIQNTIAAQFTKNANSNNKLYRLLWIPQDLKIHDEIQKAKLEQLKSDIESLIDAEIVQTPIETFKSIVNLKINDHHQKDIPQENNYDSNIYLMFDQSQLNEITPYKNVLIQHNLKVIEPVFEGNQMSIVQKHRENLVNSHACIIFGTKNSKEWVKSKIQDIKKSPGFGKKNAFQFKALITDNQSQIELAKKDKFTCLENNEKELLKLVSELNKK
jgi:hypothetical protein